MIPGGLFAHLWAPVTITVPLSLNEIQEAVNILSIETIVTETDM